MKKSDLQDKKSSVLLPHSTKSAQNQFNEIGSRLLQAGSHNSFIRQIRENIDKDIQDMRSGLHSSNSVKNLEVGELSNTAEQVHPGNFATIAFATDYLRTSIFRKYEGYGVPDMKPSSDDVTSYINNERKCHISNYKFFGGWLRSDARLEAILYIASRKISQLLQEFDMKNVYDRAKWGPGSTLSLSGNNVSVFDKVSEKPDCLTTALHHLYADLRSNDMLWMRMVLDLKVDGPCCYLQTDQLDDMTARLAFVPKDENSKRPITIESSEAVYCQLGIGIELRRVLRAWGCNLNDQTRNQKLAKNAKDLGLCTIDLKSASDLLSVGLVKRLLPPWFWSMLESCRSTLLEREVSEDETVTTHIMKYAGAGNGTTFPY